MEYKLGIEQFVSRQRDGTPIDGQTAVWLVQVEGVAKYSFADQAFDSIEETVTARPKELDETKLAALHDEVFTGTIKIQRTRSGGRTRSGR
jgi:hypothetical protein